MPDIATFTHPNRSFIFSCHTSSPSNPLFTDSFITSIRHPASSSLPTSTSANYLFNYLFLANFWDTNLIIQAGLQFTVQLRMSPNSSPSCFYLQRAGLQMCTTMHDFFLSGNTVLCLTILVVLSNCLTIVLNFITTHFESSSDLRKLNACYGTSLWKVLFLGMESTLTESLPDTNGWWWIQSPTMGKS